MKSKTSNAGSIIDQLQAGAEVLQTDPRFELPTRTTALFPIVLRPRKGSTHVDDYQTLTEGQVHFFGQRRAVRLQQCGFDLGELTRLV